MKKVILAFLLFIMPFFVYAETCNINGLSIESIDIIDSNGNASEKNITYLSYYLLFLEVVKLHIHHIFLNLFFVLLLLRSF